MYDSVSTIGLMGSCYYTWTLWMKAFDQKPQLLHASGGVCFDRQTIECNKQLINEPCILSYY